MIDKHEMIVDRYDFEDMQAELKANKEKIMLTDEFMRKVFEIAFGADAADREFTREDVLQKLREFSDTALQAVEWTAYDVREHQPEWGLVECEAWLEANEDKLRERTAELGGEALADMLMNAEKPEDKYADCTVSIYSVTYCLYDKDGNEICNEDGSTKLFKDYEGQVDTTTWAEWVEPEMLAEVDGE